MCRKKKVEGRRKVQPITRAWGWMVTSQMQLPRRGVDTNTTVRATSRGWMISVGFTWLQHQGTYSHWAAGLWVIQQGPGTCSTLPAHNVPQLVREQGPHTRVHKACVHVVGCGKDRGAGCVCGCKHGYKQRVCVRASVRMGT